MESQKLSYDVPELDSIFRSPGFEALKRWKWRSVVLTFQCYSQDYTKAQPHPMRTGHFDLASHVLTLVGLTPLPSIYRSSHWLRLVSLITATTTMAVNPQSLTFLCGPPACYSVTTKFNWKIGFLFFPDNSGQTDWNYSWTNWSFRYEKPFRVYFFL